MTSYGVEVSTLTLWYGFWFHVMKSESSCSPSLLTKTSQKMSIKIYIKTQTLRIKCQSRTAKLSMARQLCFKFWKCEQRSTVLSSLRLALLSAHIPHSHRCITNMKSSRRYSILCLLVYRKISLILLLGVWIVSDVSFVVHTLRCQWILRQIDEKFPPDVRSGRWLSRLWRIYLGEVIKMIKGRGAGFKYQKILQFQ